MHFPIKKLISLTKKQFPVETFQVSAYPIFCLKKVMIPFSTSSRIAGSL